MLELRGGSTEAEQIFRDWVVSPTDKLQLDARRDAIADYENFRSEVPLPIPPGIDDSMSRWRFDEVAAKIDDALTTWDEMNATHSRARAIGLTPPTAIEELYGEADADFSRVGQFLDSTDDVLAAFEADPNRPSEDDARNFELGRFEQIEIALERSFVAGELNAGTDGDQGIGLLLLSVFCFVALAVALFVLARMRTDAPASLDEEHTMAAVGKSRTPSL